MRQRALLHSNQMEHPGFRPGRERRVRHHAAVRPPVATRLSVAREASRLRDQRRGHRASRRAGLPHVDHATNAHATPAAVRDALSRYSTYSVTHGVDVAELTAIDLGDIAEPDGPNGEARVQDAVAAAARRCRFLIAIGGDNSLTFSVMTGLFAEQIADCGLITIDAHHDLRDGNTNGSPVRRLLAAGLAGRPRGADRHRRLLELC